MQGAYGLKMHAFYCRLACVCYDVCSQAQGGSDDWRISRAAIRTCRACWRMNMHAFRFLLRLGYHHFFTFVLILSLQVIVFSQPPGSWVCPNLEYEMMIFLRYQLHYPLSLLSYTYHTLLMFAWSNSCSNTNFNKRLNCNKCGTRM